MSAPIEDDDLLETDDYYAWLGTHKDASHEEINNAFRKMSRIYHPDKHAMNEGAVHQAEKLFTKIKKAHEVLTDPHKRAIYDTLGIKGLETEGWQIVPRRKTPQEILKEYEELQAEREQRLLNQRTNPTGSVSVGIDATDMFDSYSIYDGDYGPSFPHIEVTQMSITQSVECPLTTKDTAEITGNVQVSNGNGSGSISTSFRRVLSSNSWAETGVSAGNDLGFSVRGFRRLWSKAYGTMSGTCQITSKGIKPLYSVVIAQQLDKTVQGRMNLTLGPSHSSLQTNLVWENERNRVAFTFQLGMPSTFISLNYLYIIPDYDVKLRARLRLGTLSFHGEYGCEKKITKFSTLGATMCISIPNGVVLHIKLRRGNQNFTFPIHLSDEISHEPIVYGTVVPLMVYAAVKALLVTPFLKEQREKDLKRKKEANVTLMQEKKKEAEDAIELMQATIERISETEKQKGGLVINKALYGKLEGESVDSQECINVTQPLQILVKDSKIVIAEGTKMSELQGFYDPCVGEDKQICVTYTFRNQLHICTFSEGEKIILPNRSHLCGTSPEDR